MKYAVIINTCASFIPGFNALLNSLDLYKNHIDVYAVVENMPEDYMEAIKKANWNFNLHILDFFELIEKYKMQDLCDTFQRATFVFYPLMLELKDKYDAIGLFGADQLTFANIDKFYEIAAKTGLIVTGRNSIVTGDYDEEEERHKYQIDTDFYWDTPFIINPKTWEKLLEAIWDKRYLYNNMRAMNRSLQEMKLTDRVFQLPDIAWNSERYYIYDMRMGYDFDGLPYVLANFEKVYACHKRWWLDNFIGSAVREDPRAQANAKMIRGLFGTFNKIGKVKINYENGFYSGCV
jgi:hypothetical protein